MVVAIPPIKMVIVHSYVSLPEGNEKIYGWWF